MQKISEIALKYKERTERRTEILQKQKELVDAYELAHPTKACTLHPECRIEGFAFQFSENGFEIKTAIRHNIQCSKCAEIKFKDDQIQKFLHTANIPNRYKDVVADDYHLQEFLDSGIIFTGQVGTGKTHQLIALLKAVIQSQVQKCEFVTFGELTRIVRGSIKDNTYNEVYEDFAHREFLFLDDMGTENTTDFMKEFFYNLINDRYNNMKPTAITTNLSSEELRQLYSERFVSRLLGICKVVKIEGKDRRY